MRGRHPAPRGIGAAVIPAKQWSKPDSHPSFSAPRCPNAKPDQRWPTPRHRMVVKSSAVRQNVRDPSGATEATPQQDGGTVSVFSASFLWHVVVRMVIKRHFPDGFGSTNDFMLTTAKRSHCNIFASGMKRSDCNAGLGRRWGVRLVYFSAKLRVFI